MAVDPLFSYPYSGDPAAPPPSWAHHHPAAAAAGDQADDGPDDQPSSRKVKFLCSFGGRILPRPSDGTLRYAGGQTRIIAVRRDASFPDLMTKMEDAYGGGPVAVRYQLPDVDLDALVSVSSPEDLENMMEEYDKLAEAAPDGSAKLRVFLFSPSDLATDPSSTLAYIASDLSDTGQRYFEAVNGISSSKGSLRRKDSLLSATSTQNSDAPLIGADAVAQDGTNEGTSPALVSPTAAASHDPSRLFFVEASNTVGFSDAPGLPANPLAVGSGIPAQTLSSSRPELPPHAYVGSNQVQYMNPKSLGTGSASSNVVAVPPHSYVHISTAPMVSQVGSVNPIQAKVDTHLEENPYSGRVAQLHSDPNYKTFQPLSQLPPLVPSYLQPQNAEWYGLRQVPPPPQGQALRLEECYKCHTALPHSHSDPMIQDNGLGGAVPGVSPVFHSHHSEDATRLRAPKLVNGGLVDSVVEPKAESTVAAGHFGAYGFTQIPEIRRDNERLVPPNSESFDHGKALCPPGTVGLSGDTQAAYGMFANLPQSRPVDSLQQQQQQQLPQTLGLTQFPVKQDAIAQSCGIDVYPVKNVITQAAEPLSRDSVLDSSYDYIRPVEGMMGALHVNPFESPVFNEKWKPIVAPDLGVSKELIPENPAMVLEKCHSVRPQVGGNTMFFGNGYINHGLIPAGNCVAPIDQVPSSSLGFTQLHNHQAALSNQVPTSGTYLFNQETGVQHMVSNGHLLETPSYSCSINPAYSNNTTSKISAGDGKDESSRFHPDVLNDIAAPPGGNVPFPLPNSSGTNGHAEQFQEPLLSDSLFCNQDPRKILGSTHLLPPRPSWVASNEPIIPKDSSVDNCLINSKGSDIAVFLEEDIFHQPLNSLNKDSCSEPAVRTTKDSVEEQIKQDLQAVAEGVAASVLQSSGTTVPLSFACEKMESASQSIQEREVIENGVCSQSAAALGDHRIEGIKTKQLDKMYPGFPITDDIGRLQIIKNSDLEELRELGSGTFGTVYHGKWRGSDVAIKRINDRCFTGKPSDQERMRADFWNEACKLADLHHPNVVAFYGLVLDGPEGSVATVTEYMVNGSLRNVLQKSDKTLDRRKRILIAMDVAFGMEYLHAKNIVHFDLKSDNLLVNLRDPQRPICKVGDLGLSKVKCQTLISGGVRGTLPWMAPELLNGSSSMVSEKVDVFSFGIVMWELLTREEPYADLHYGAIIGGIVSNTLRPPVPESCDPEWRSLMEKCWSSDPLERPSFTEIANRLRAMSTSLPSKARPQEQQQPQPQPLR